MSLKNYGVLKGRPINRRLGFGASPHYQVYLVDAEADYSIAVNVKSKGNKRDALNIYTFNSHRRPFWKEREVVSLFTSEYQACD